MSEVQCGMQAALERQERRAGSGTVLELKVRTCHLLQHSGALLAAARQRVTLRVKKTGQIPEKESISKRKRKLALADKSVMRGTHPA